jgi:ABC-type transport system involved in multi-copper enzyme maturation permease subunit
MTKHLVAPALATLRIDLSRSLSGKRGIPLFILAALAPLLTLVIGHFQIAAQPGRLVTQYANLFRYFVLSGTLFFGAGWCFSNLIRGEVLEKSLHYFFLTPAPRDGITLGKYLTGVLATWLVFVPATIVSYVLLFAQGGPRAIEHLRSAAGIGALVAYAGITLLACAAYGALFLACGLIAKSPFIPIIGLWLFERASLFLPAILKRLTMIHYLDSLLPVPHSTGVFALLAEPEPLAIALLLPLALSAALIVVACRKVRRMEISYGVE